MISWLKNEVQLFKSAFIGFSRCKQKEKMERGALLRVLLCCRAILLFSVGKMTNRNEMLYMEKKALTGQTFWAITLLGVESSRGINYWKS